MDSKCNLIILPLIRQTYIIVVIALFFTCEMLSQEVKYELGPNIMVASDPEGRLFIEPHLTSDPTNPNRLFAVSFIDSPTPQYKNGDICAVFSSTDAGDSWTRHDLTCISCADPWVTVTNKGLVFVTALGKHPSLPDPEIQLLVFVSSDGGLTWGDVPQSLGRYHDGTRSIAGPDGTLYILSGQSLRDDAQNLRFSLFIGKAEPGRPHVNAFPRVFPSNLNQVSDGLALLSDGSLVITYDDFQRKANGGFRTRAGALKGRRSWAMLSEDGGQSFSMPLFLTETCWTRPTFLAVDSSGGPFQDRLYYICEGDNQRELILTYSSDRGEEWTTTSIELSADQDGFRTEPQIAVNKQGVLGIAWMDRRDDPSGKCYAPYFTTSIDGGQTFSKPIRVSTELSCPDIAQFGAAGRRWNTGGDYFGLSAAADGRFHLLWPDARNGTFELWTTHLSVSVSNKN